MRIGSRIITFVILVVITSAAFALPSNAAAEKTSLCSNDSEACSTISHVHETTLSGAKAELLTSIVNVKCDVLFLGEVVEEGSPLVIEGNLTYTNCGSCTVEEVGGGVEIQNLKTGHETADVTGEGEVHVNCSGLNCYYNGEELLGIRKGPLLSSETNGEVKLSEQVVNKVKGLFCPSTSKLDIVVTPLSAIYLNSGGLPVTSTSISTSLKGGGKEGAEITVLEGSKVKDTATLSGTNASTATGTVHYAVYKDKECKELVTKAGEVTVKEGKVPDSEEKELEAGKEYFWQAKYLGDSMNEASTSTCSKEVLKVKAKVTLTTKLSGGGKEGEEITVAEGSKVKDTATLSGTNASGATGTVDYSVYKDKECKELATEAGKGKVEGTKAASSEEKELEVGVYYWQAKYLGDSLHEESTSTCSKEVLNVKKKFDPHKTALCTADDAGLTCLEEHKPSSVDFKDSAAEFLTSLISTKCEGLISGSVGAAGEPQKVTGEYKFSSCTNGCIVTEISGGSQLGFLFETSEESTEELAAATTEGLELFYKCGETVKCAYGPIEAAGDSLGGLKTGDNGHITFSKDSFGEGEGLFCPEKASLDALFVASSAFYVRKDYGPTSLCSKDEGSPVCKSENQLKTIDYKDKAVELLTSLINVKCEGLVSGAVGEPGNPLEIKLELTYTGCSGGCFVTSVAGPGKIMLERTKSEEAKATAESFEIFVKCGTTIKCLLGPEKMAGTALGALTTGDNGHLTFSKVSLGKGEGATCPKEATLDALYVASSAAYIG
jgi:hypothetical protein